MTSPRVHPESEGASARRPRHGRLIRLLRWLAGVVLVVTLIAAAGYAFLSSTAGLDYALRELAARSGGDFQAEGATGSLLETMHVRRLTWRGPEASVTARDVTLAWRPAALWSHRVAVQTLDAGDLEVEIKPSTTAASPPASLALPFEVGIEHLSVSRLDVRVGPSSVTIRGLALSYAGGAAGHRLTDLQLATDLGALSGDATIAADPPFAIGGRVAVHGDGAVAGAEASIVLSGSLAALAVDASGTAESSRFTAHAALAPLATVPLQEIIVDARAIDLSAWNKALPATRLDAVIRARPAGDGLAGAIEATNALPGSIDAGRIPLLAVSGAFVWRANALALDRLVAVLPGGGSATGSGRIPLRSGVGAGSWSIAMREVDLKQIYAPLDATRLSGTLTAELDQARQRVRGDVADRRLAGGVALEFVAEVADREIAVERFVARARGSSLAGSGRLALRGEQAFALNATTQRLDPARFGAFPAGALDGRIVATGVLKPAWRASLDVTVAPGSKLAGVTLSGSAAGTVRKDAIRDARIALQVATATLTVEGSAGAAGDGFAIAVDAPRLADLAPALPAGPLRSLTGSVRARAAVQDGFRSGAIALDATAQGLSLGTELALGTLDLRAALAAGPPAANWRDLAARDIRVSATATGLATPQGKFSNARADFAGTLATHAASVALASDDLTVNAAAHGALGAPADASRTDGPSWSGTLDTLAVGAQIPLRLAVPAAVTFAKGQIRIGETRLEVADGNLHLADFTWDGGRIATHGRFTGVPLATATRLAGAPLPFESTLTLGGEWSLAAAPRLNGTVTIRREAGDLRLRADAIDQTAIPLGITALELHANLNDDAVDATASVDSTSGGVARARLAIGVDPAAKPGRIGANAPLALTLNAELATLKAFQPWIGTAAVIDGRAVADVVAGGVLSRATLGGTLRATGLRVDAPQYGLHFTAGRLAARLAERRLIVDELVLTAGGGQFVASGSVATARKSGTAAADQITWKASRFRLFNRPDLRLVVDGEGTLVSEAGRITLAGKVRADEGRIVHVVDKSATLGEDVVVKSRSRQAAPSPRTRVLPLGVDLALDFGDRLSVAIQGLEARLAGNLRVTTGPNGFVGHGSVRTVNGTYVAFGRKLVIDPGRLIFDGPLDNPGLDIVALRKNLPVEAGVTVQGTVKVPIVRLTANVPVSDSEKLSWLVLGQGLDRASGPDLAALQGASTVLLGRDKPITATIAQRIGVDDITFRGTTGATGGSAGSQETAGQVVAVGKRISDKLAVVYEQGLSTASSALKLEYALTRNVTVRAEAGIVSGVGVQYNRAFD